MKQIAAFTSVLVLALSIVVGAKSEKTHASGTVVSSTATAIVITTKKGHTKTIAVDTQTKVMRAGTAMKLTDVKPGERVEVSLATRNDREIAAEVDVLAPKSGKKK